MEYPRSLVCVKCRVSHSETLLETVSNPNEFQSHCIFCRIDKDIELQLWRLPSRPPVTLKTVRAKSVEKSEDWLLAIKRRGSYISSQEEAAVRSHAFGHQLLRHADTETTTQRSDQFDRPTSPTHQETNETATVPGPCKQCKRTDHELWFFNLKPIRDGDKRARKLFTQECARCRAKDGLHSAFKQNRHLGHPDLVGEQLHRCAHEMFDHWHSHVQREADRSRDETVKQELLSMRQQLTEITDGLISHLLRRLPNADQALQARLPIPDDTEATQQPPHGNSEAADDMPLEEIETRRLNGTEPQCLPGSSQCPTSMQRGRPNGGAAPTATMVGRSDADLVPAGDGVQTDMSAMALARFGDPPLPTADQNPIQQAPAAGDVPEPSILRAEEDECAGQHPTTTKAPLPVAMADETAEPVAALATAWTNAKDKLPFDKYQSRQILILALIQKVVGTLESDVKCEEEEKLDLQKAASRRKEEEEAAERLARRKKEEEEDQQKSAKRKREDEEAGERLAKRRKEREEADQRLAKLAAS